MTSRTPGAGPNLDELYQLLDDLPPAPEPIRLTADQLAALKDTLPTKTPEPWDTTWWARTVPIVLVDRVEESTPYVLAAAQGLRQAWADRAEQEQASYARWREIAWHPYLAPNTMAVTL
jgi:hypothetical protein